MTNNEELVCIPLGVGKEMTLVELLATHLFTLKKRIDDTNVYPMAIHIIVSLEKYRQNKDLVAFGRALELSPETIKMYVKDPCINNKGL
jgi:hypothetical protein